MSRIRIPDRTPRLGARPHRYSAIGGDITDYRATLPLRRRMSRRSAGAASTASVTP